MPGNSRTLLVAILMALTLPAAPSAFAEEPASWNLRASEWSRPRNGAAVTAMPPIAEAVRAWHRALAQGDANARLQLLHASGEEGGLWAAELRDWLVALGVSPSAIEIVPAGLSSDRLELRVLHSVNET